MDNQDINNNFTQQPINTQEEFTQMAQQATDTQKLIAQPQPAAKQRVRRVGTITMGASLIITGIALCALVFIPFNDVIIVAKLAPLLLVALGIEVIVYTTTNKDVKLKYDFLSILMCLFIIFGAMSASLVPTLFQYFGPEREQMEQNVETGIIDEFKKDKDKYPNLYTITTSTNIMRIRTFVDTDGLNALTPSDWLYSYAELSNITSKEQFAKEALEVYKKLTSLSSARVQFTCSTTRETEKPYYTVEFRGRYINEPTVDEILKQIEVYSISDISGSYVSEDEYAQEQEDAKMEQERIALDKKAQDKYEKEQAASSIEGEITTE